MEGAGLGGDEQGGKKEEAAAAGGNAVCGEGSRAQGSGWRLSPCTSLGYPGWAARASPGLCWPGMFPACRREISAYLSQGETELCLKIVII